MDNRLVSRTLLFTTIKKNNLTKNSSYILFHTGVPTLSGPSQGENKEMRELDFLPN